jgi:hypothetical protein
VLRLVVPVSIRTRFLETSPLCPLYVVRHQLPVHATVRLVPLGITVNTAPVVLAVRRRLTLLVITPVAA